MLRRTAELRNRVDIGDNQSIFEEIVRIECVNEDEEKRMLDKTYSMHLHRDAQMRHFRRADRYCRQ